MFEYKRDPVYRYTLDIRSLNNHLVLNNILDRRDFNKLCEEIQGLSVIDLKSTIPDFDSTEAPESLDLRYFEEGYDKAKEDEWGHNWRTV